MGRFAKQSLGTTGGGRKKIGEFGRKSGRIPPVSKHTGETQNRAVAQPFIVGRMAVLLCGNLFRANRPRLCRMLQECAEDRI